MKNYEKAMIYFLLPFAYMWHGVKKTGQFAVRQAKPALSLLIAAIMLLSVMPTNVFAAGITNKKNSVVVTPYNDLGKNDAEVAKALAEMFLSDKTALVEGSASISYANKEQIATVSGGTELLGIEGGFALSTGSVVEDFGGSADEDYDGTKNKDADLAKYIEEQNQEYKGDTAALQFTVKATGTDLNFRYVFGSKEFNQVSKYNDIFGLFIKVNDGEFENIAFLPNGKTVTITNLRTDPDTNPNGDKISKDIDLIYVNTDYNKLKSGFNGFSKILTAKKKVEIGDTVTVKFVIADVGDKAYDSAIIMQEDSLSFVDADKNLTSSTGNVSIELNKPVDNGASDFTVKVDGQVLDPSHYTVEAVNTINPKIIFKESAGLTCRSEVEISIAGISKSIDISNSIPCEWNESYEKDTEGHWHTCKIDGCTDTTEKENHSINKYRFENNGKWEAACECGQAIDNGEIVVTYYDGVYDGQAHNAVSVSGCPDGVTVNYSTDNGANWSDTVPEVLAVTSQNVLVKVIKNSTEWTNANDGKEHNSYVRQADLDGVQSQGYSGIYDGNPHGITVNAPTGATVKYGTTEGTYDKTTSPTITNVGTLTVYYEVTKENYKTVTGLATIVIDKAPLTVTANDKTITYGDAPANDGVTYSGFVSNEIETVLGGTLGYDYSYIQYGNVGDYDITPKGLTSDNYEITFQKGVLTVEQHEISIHWGATEFIPYNESKQLPEVSAGSLVNGDKCELTVEVVETVEGAGIIPGRWHARITALSNGNYCLPKDGRLVTVEYGIVKGSQAAPTVSGVNETIKGKADGKITGLTTEMEYSTEFTADDDKYIKITDPDMTFASGTYYVRYCEKQYYNPSTFTEVTIGEGRKLTVTVPAEQSGYELKTAAAELDWHGSTTLTFTLAEGYTKTNEFSVSAIGAILNDNGDGTYTVFNAQDDVVITVVGVADITPPQAEISIKDNKWSQFWNNLTFDLVFNETQDVTITANDNGSGVNTIEYYIAGGEMERDEVESITDWKTYDGTFKIEPNNEYVVYAKVTDKAGNVVYVNSDGVILDNIAPTLEGIENGKTYYGDLTVIKSDEQFYDIKIVTLDGEPMGFAEGTYGLIPADNTEHTVVVEDYAGNKTTYVVAVMKNYTVTYKVDGVTVNTQTIGHGKDAIAPAIPEKEGYTQTAPTWDKDGKNITADTEINAVYTINKYTVTYKAGGEVVGTVEVEHGKDAIAPAIPEKEGYTQIAPTWDKDGKNIIADTEINAVYTINEYTITFIVEDGVFKTFTVKHGEKFEMPKAPQKDGHDVCWEKDNYGLFFEKVIDDVTEDITFKAVYSKIYDNNTIIGDEETNTSKDTEKSEETKKPEKTEPTDKPKSPKTMDNSLWSLWLALAFISGGVLFAFVLENKKRKTE